MKNDTPLPPPPAAAAPDPHPIGDHGKDDARAAANRLNAQRSTGPRSGDGKARSSQNARRAGWFARHLAVADGHEQLYLEFEEAWLDELRPYGLAELEVFHDFVRALWHKREIIEAQNRLVRSSAAAFDSSGGPDRVRELDRYHRYERDFERRAARHLAELRRLQTERALRELHPAVAATRSTPVANSRALPQKRTQLEPEPSLAFDLLSGLTAAKPTVKPAGEQPKTPPEGA